MVYKPHAYTDRVDRIGGTYSALRRNSLGLLYSGGAEITTPNVQALRDASRTTVPGEDALGGTDGGAGIRVDLSERTRPGPG